MIEMQDKVAEAILNELATFNVAVVVQMAKEQKSGACGDLTPFNLMAIAALRAARDYLLANGWTCSMIDEATQ